MAAAAIEASQVRLPEIHTKGIYDGRFKDRNPIVRPAGKLTATGDTAKNCMKPNGRPDSPEVIRRFRATIRPDAGQARVFYGKAHDPHLQWAANMTHGLSSQPSVMASELLNPAPNSMFKQATLNKKEDLYLSHQKAPLGTSHNQASGLPNGLNPTTFTFGIQTEKDGSAGELISPYKTWPQVEEESEVGRHLYRMTHADYHPGEKCDRNYTHPSYDDKKRFGIPTPHDNAGRAVRKTLKWLHDTQAAKTAPIVAKRVDDFRERTQPQLGKVHDPIKDTLNVPSDHTFGILIKPDQYGAGDLMHGRARGDYLRGKDRIRGVIGAMRQHLKKANYHNFSDLLSAFRFYDKNDSGHIDIAELQEACAQFNLPVEPELLVQLMDYCDTNKDGQIDYLEFSNFLNWKDKMASGFPPASAGARLSEDSEQADLVQKNPQSAECTPRRLAKQIDSAIGKHRTSSGMINAVVGGISTRDYRTYGVPTNRTDLPAPRIRRIDDCKSYGDKSDAYGLVNPSIYSTHGVHEKDFLLPRPKEEIFSIFKNIGVLMTLDDFDRIYAMAAQRHPKGLVCVESFRNVLDECQALELQNKDLA